ncbi:sulfite exporter TauE/SafE family protein [Maliponia aquimaris]|uniref:Probable membrane transporter protein n=1 Tax=Maliponia aquimaris TaxID=1673631 RepID=A0A238KE48_9RHOB|nr:sulfite exporter TauE/SafE family protein [Maliponia aquimaris]SMX41088.1 Sulfite exporter TauE/SafE [Maliponia aquimaris]
MAEALHAGLGWPVALTILAVSFASSFITAAFGIGGGAVMLAVLATLLPAPAIIPVHGIVQFGSNIGRAALLLKYLHLAVVGPFLGGALIGVGLGGMFVVQLDPAVIQVSVGLFILWSILTTPPAFMRRSGAVAGGISSFLTMFFGGTGPFVAAYVKTLKLDRLAHVSTHSTLMTIQHLLKTLAFGLLGFAFSAWAGLITLLIVFGFLGTVAGRHVLTRIDEKRFRFALNLILTVLAARLIYAGGMALWATPQMAGG